MARAASEPIPAPSLTRQVEWGLVCLGEKVWKRLWVLVQQDPVFMRRVNGWLTLFWLLASIPIVLFLANSVPFLVFISVYAVVTGHWATWQASRVEVRQEEEENNG